MKVYPEEIEQFKALPVKAIPHFSPAQNTALRVSVKAIRDFSRAHPRLHFVLQLLPYFVLSLLWASLIFIWIPALPTLILKILVLSLVHGFLGYSFVVYALHEGAGHRLFAGEDKISKLFRYLAFHSSRLQAADPEFYHQVHGTHHRHLGTEQDLSFAHFILTRRILKSLLPGAGTVFPSDYKIHQGPTLTRSGIFSLLLGGLFVALEIYLLSPTLPIVWAFLSLAVITPWIGFSLDRLRESMEHQHMASDKIWGSRELGLGFSGLIIGGGYSGQSCHFTHHLAPDLNWYQQIYLHFQLKKTSYKGSKSLFRF